MDAKNVQKQGRDGIKRHNYTITLHLSLNFYIYTSLLIPISSSDWPFKLHSPLRESITFSW